MDEDGRVCSPQGPLTRSMTFEPSSRVLDDFILAERVEPLRECCERCFKVKPSKGRYSSGKTFWAAWEQKPRCELEALALAILHKHCPEPAAPSGVEWWTLCLDSDSDVGWHWDRDYVLEDSGVNAHPMLATVTYLSPSAAQAGVSTVTLDLCSPPQRDEARPVALPLKGRNVACTMVQPRPGRHLVFDGRFLHGAPRALGGGDDAKATRRVTFMANIWVGHKPANASTLLPELQVWSSCDEGCALVATSPAEVSPSRAADAQGACADGAVAGEMSAGMRAFPLEGGTLRVALPAAAKDGGTVVAARVAASWQPKPPAKACGRGRGRKRGAFAKA